jgi:hypothetical protein
MRALLLSVSLVALTAAAASAQTPCYAENGDNNFSDNVSTGGPNLTVGIRFVAPTNLTANAIEVFTGEQSGINGVQIWSHNAALNQPLAVLGSGSWSMAATNSWQGASLAPQVSLVAGTTYWLGWSPINGSQSSVDFTLPGTGQVYRGSFDGGQTWSGPFQNNTHWKFKIFCDTTTTYCTPKVNSLGCTPAIGSTGTPSTSAQSGFVVQGSNVRNQKSGLLFYGVNGQASLPFQGGTLCVKSPIKRTPAVSSGGTPLPTNDCTGVFSIDMNSFAQGLLGGSPSPALLVPGTVVDCQWWGRDPGFPAPNNTTLTNGLEYTL